MGGSAHNRPRHMITMTEEGKRTRVNEVLAILGGLSHEDRVLILREVTLRNNWAPLRKEHEHRAEV